MLGQRPGPDGVDRSAAARTELQRLDADPSAWDPPTAEWLSVELARVFGDRDLVIARVLALTGDERSPVPAVARALTLSHPQARRLVSAHRAAHPVDTSAHDQDERSPADERSPQDVSA
jgi:hypothetical protein